MLKNLTGKLIPVLAAAIIIFAAGCGEKKETPQIEEEATVDTTEMIDTTTVEEVTIPDITGTWTGKLDAHASTLRITEQDSLSFKGRLSTKFREEINQEVSGKFNPDDRTLTMTDLLHSRYQGTYYAKLNEDLTSMSGTFTMKLDNSNLSFNYTKK